MKKSISVPCGIIGTQKKAMWPIKWLAITFEIDVTDQFKLREFITNKAKKPKKFVLRITRK